MNNQNKITFLLVLGAFLFSSAQCVTARKPAHKKRTRQATTTQAKETTQEAKSQEATSKEINTTKFQKAYSNACNALATRFQITRDRAAEIIQKARIAAVNRAHAAGTAIATGAQATVTGIKTAGATTLNVTKSGAQAIGNGTKALGTAVWNERDTIMKILFILVLVEYSLHHYGADTKILNFLKKNSNPSELKNTLINLIKWWNTPSPTGVPPTAMLPPPGTLSLTTVLSIFSRMGSQWNLMFPGNSPLLLPGNKINMSSTSLINWEKINTTMPQIEPAGLFNFGIFIYFVMLVARSVRI